MLVFLAWWRVFNKSEILLPKVVYYDFLWALNPSWKSSPTELSINFLGPRWQPHGHQHVHPLHHLDDDWKKTIYLNILTFPISWCSLWWNTWTPRAGWWLASTSWPPPSWWQKLIFATWSLSCQGDGLSHNGDTSGPPLLNTNSSVDTLKTSSRYSKTVLFSNDSWVVTFLIVL